MEYLETRWVPATIQVSGHALWLVNPAWDPIPDAKVQIVELITIGTKQTGTVLAQTYTDVNGSFTAAVKATVPTVGIGSLVAYVRSESPHTDIGPDAKTVFTLASNTITVTPALLKAGTATLTAQAGAAGGLNRAFSILSALEQAANFGRYLAGGAALPSVPVIVNPSVHGAYTTQDDVIFLNPVDAFDWDVIQHEYGHFVEDQLHVADVSGGGPHSFRVHMAGDVAEAFNEGWADYFPIAAQARETNLPYAAHVPNVGDTSYSDMPDSETDSGLVLDLATQVGSGEDDEISTASFLYHLTAGDQGYKLGDKAVFDIFRAKHVLTIGRAWGALASGLSVQNRVQLGLLLALQNVAPLETGPADNASLLLPPLLEWNRNGAGYKDIKGNSTYYLDTFAISFYTPDYKLIRKIQVPASAVGSGPTVRFTPSASDWAAITSGRDKVLWVVEGRHTAKAPITPGGLVDAYWSQARTLQRNSLSLSQTFRQYLSPGQVYAFTPNSNRGFLALVKVGVPVATSDFKGTINWGDGESTTTVTVFNVPWLGPTYYALMNTHPYKSNGPVGTGSQYNISFTLSLLDSPGQSVSGTTYASVSNTG